MRLSDDRRVIAVSRRVDDAEGEGRRLKGGTEPRPREAAVTVLLQPGMEVIGAHHPLEASRVGGADVAEQLARRVLLVRSVVAEERHEKRRDEIMSRSSASLVVIRTR